MGKKNKDKIRVSFPSASAEHVAGSQVLIEFGKEKEQQKILVECGLIQGENTLLKEYQANSKKFSFKPKNLTAVFACHLHSDHIGLIPRLYKEGCKAKILVPVGTKKILKEMLLDSSRIMQRDSIALSKKFKKEYAPIYTEDNVYQSLEFIQEYEKYKKYEFNKEISFEFVDSGHIINSCQLILWIKNGNSVKKIAITSDLGNKSIKQYYTEKFEPITSANLIIGETTYCDKKRKIKLKDRDKDLEKIKSSILTTCNDKNGAVLIPTFSLQRFQVILTHLYDLFKDDKEAPNIYATSPLALKISELFVEELPNEEQKKKWEEVKNWNKIFFLKDFDTLQEKLKEDKKAVYVASAGMMNAGYSVYIASQLMPKEKNTILFCGFVSPNSLGYKIKQKKTKTVSIDGKQVPSKCNIISLNSFSSHMQYDDLKWYYSSYNFDKIALVHGDFKTKVIFAKELQEELSNKNKTGKVICVNNGTELLL